jgi:50S ribosomal subunit-associated GTPase HflX
VANKVDLPPQVMQERLDHVAKALGDVFVLTSAKTGEGVPAAFDRLAKRITGVS